MKEYTVKLDGQQFESLKSFLERSTMSGKEVQSFMSVVNAINQAERLADQTKVEYNLDKNKAPSPPNKR